MTNWHGFALCFFYMLRPRELHACEFYECWGEHSRCSNLCEGGRWLDLEQIDAKVTMHKPQLGPTHGASMAIDNNPETCAMFNDRPRWVLDLQRMYRIAAVRITSRQTTNAANFYLTGVSENLSEIDLSVGETKENLSHRHRAIHFRHKEIKTIRVAAKGRYIMISKNYGAVILCELEVFVVPRIVSSELGTNLDECIFATPGAATPFLGFTRTKAVPLQAKPTCWCESGWEGKNCDQRVDTCAYRNPCNETEMCINNPDGTHHCKCSPGWFGPECSHCHDTDEDSCMGCYSNDNELTTRPTPKTCIRKLPANGKHSMILSPSCALANNEFSFLKAIEATPKASEPQFDDVLVMLATYYFDERMFADWGQWNREFKALNAELARQKKTQRYHFAIAYTGMLDEKPTPLSTWTDPKNFPRLLKCAPKCTRPPHGVEVIEIMKEHMPKAHFFEEHSVWFHGHYSISFAMKNIYEAKGRNFSHVWFIDPDVAFMGNFAKFVHFQMLTRGETVLGTCASANSLSQAYKYYTRPSIVSIGDWGWWKHCPGFKMKDRRGLVPMLLRMSKSVLDAFPLYWDRACFLEVFIPSVCATHLPDCTIGTLARGFHGYIHGSDRVFRNGHSAKILKALSLDWKANQSTMYHPVKMHTDWRSEKPQSKPVDVDLFNYWYRLQLEQPWVKWNSATNEGVWTRHGVTFHPIENTQGFEETPMLRCMRNE